MTTHYSWLAMGTVYLLAGVAAAQQPGTVIAGGGEDASVFVDTASVLSRPVTLKLDGAPLRNAIEAVARSAHVQVGYRAELLSTVRKEVTLSLSNVSLSVAMARVLEGTTLRLIVLSPTNIGIVGTRGDTTVNAPTGGVIRGVVVDSSAGRAIPQVTVSLEGTKLSTTTRQDGTFILNGVPAGDYTVIAKLLGYKRSQQKVHVTDGEQQAFRFVLASAPTLLSGMVTTATGRQRKLEIGNSIATINVEELMEKAPVSSLADILEARVPGVQVTRSSGAPGDPSRVRLRGAGSIGQNNDPIIIVDGIRMYAEQSDQRNANRSGKASGTLPRGPLDATTAYAAPSPIDQIDPNSIETIDIFKGPSASALYGADAANGVIVITTKRGRAGKTVWTGSLESGTTYMPGNYPENVVRWGHGYNLPSRPYTLNDQFAVDITFDSVTRFQALNDPRYTVFGRGSHQGISSTISGGSPLMTYSLTGSGASNIGLIRLPGIEVARFEKYHGAKPPTWMRRPDKYSTWGGSGSVVLLPSSATTITYTGSLFRSAQQRSSLESAVPTLMGTYIDTAQLDQNPLVGAFYERARANGLATTHALSVHWVPFEWLPITATTGINVQLTDQETLLPRGLLLTSIDSTGRYGASHGTAMEKTGDVNTTIPIPLGRWRLPTSLGVNIAQKTINDSYLTTNTLQYGQPVPSQFVDPFAGQSIVGNTTYGWFFEPKFDFKSRFFITPGFRLDGGSAYGSRARVGGLPSTFAALFPRLNFSWIASDQPKFPLKNVISMLQLRTSYGHAGVQPSPEDKLRTYSNNPTTLNGVVTSDLAALLALGNTKLRPERSTEIDGGFLLGLWDDRFQLDFTRYRKRRIDAIIEVPVAPSVNGGGQIKQNIGQVLNTGTEIQLNSRIIQTRPVAWTVDLGITRNNSVVERLAPGVDTRVLSNTSRIVPGYPLFGRWAQPIVSYGDIDGDGAIRPDEVLVGDSLVFLGPEDPRFTINGNTGIELFNSRLVMNAGFSYVNGQTQFNAGGADLLARIVNDPSATPGQRAAYAALEKTSYGLIQTVQTLRLQSLSIAYLVPSQWSRRFRTSSMRVALQGSNLGLWTNYRGKDPNVNAISVGNETGDNGQLPTPREWRIRVTLEK